MTIATQAPAADTKPRFPDFLCIGAQKAGTTWLHFQLAQYKSVWMPRIKELQYFNEIHMPGHRSWTARHRLQHAGRALQDHVSRLQQPDDVDWDLTAELTHIAATPVSDPWYGAIFQRAPQGSVAGEMTPEYSLLPDEGIAHLLSLNERVRIIFMVRDPVDRAWSHMRMLFRRRQEVPSLDDMRRMAGQPDILRRSDYTAILSRWLRHVPEDRFLVLDYEGLGKDPEGVMRSVCAFLGIEYDPGRSAALRTKIHVGDPGALPPEIHATLRANLQSVYAQPHPLLERLGVSWLRHPGP